MSIEWAEPPDEALHVTLIQVGGSERLERIPYSAAVDLMQAFRHFKLTKRGRIVGVFTNTGFACFDLQNYSEVHVKVTDSKRFAKLVEAKASLT
jgi:hypothetical protein